MKNRELKFRVWNGTEMVYDVTVGKFGVFYVNPSNNGLDPNDSASITPFTTKYHEDTPVMQSTGLKDKHGKEIWEGDVLAKIVTDYRHDDYQAYVDSGYETKEPTKLIYDYCTLERFRYWLNNERFGYEGEDLENPDEWEVIGNIWENYELL